MFGSTRFTSFLVSPLIVLPLSLSIQASQCGSDDVGLGCHSSSEMMSSSTGSVCGHGTAQPERQGLPCGPATTDALGSPIGGTICSTSSTATEPRQLLSEWLEDPAVWFSDGQLLYRAGRFHEAMEKFRYAAEKDPTKAQYVYFLALTEWQLGFRHQASGTVQNAALIEVEHPISNWGYLMERYQGYSRLWLEKSRRYAVSQLAVVQR